jgi:hypothetical protein
MVDRLSKLGDSQGKTTPLDNVFVVVSEINKLALFVSFQLAIIGNLLVSV